MTVPATRRPVAPLGHDEAIDELRGHGARVTPAKRAVLELFLRGGAGLTAEEVCGHLPDINKATVYRILAQFEDAGILEHAHLGHGAATYRRAGSDTVLVVCDVCGHTMSLPTSELHSLVRRVRGRYGIDLDFTHFALTGRCAACSDEHG